MIRAGWPATIRRLVWIGRTLVDLEWRLCTCRAMKVTGVRRFSNVFSLMSSRSAAAPETLVKNCSTHRKAISPSCPPAALSARTIWPPGTRSTKKLNALSPDFEFFQSNAPDSSKWLLRSVCVREPERRLANWRTLLSVWQSSILAVRYCLQLDTICRLKKREKCLRVRVETGYYFWSNWKLNKAINNRARQVRVSSPGSWRGQRSSGEADREILAFYSSCF